MYVDESGLVVSGVVPRGAAMGLGGELLRRAIEDRFRNQQGAAYAPWSLYERVDADQAVLVGGSDIRRNALATLANNTMELTRAVVRTPDLERLADLKASMAQSVRDPYAQFAVVMRGALATLHGQQVQTAEEIVAELESVSPHEVVVGLERFASTLLVGLPGDTAWRDEMPRIRPRTVVPVVKGRRHRSLNWPTERARLVVGDDAIQLSWGDEARVVRLRDAEGVLAHENGLRHVVGQDGYGITVNPYMWHGGADAVRRLDERTPPAKRLPMPPADGLERPARLGLVRRWTGPMRGKVTTAGLLRTAYITGGLAVIVGGLALAIVGHIGVVGIGTTILGVRIIRGAVADL
jgi:zinc protease